MSRKSITDKLGEIDMLIDWFSGANFDIDEALIKFEQLTKLSEEIKVDLDQLENKITVIKQKFGEE